MKKLVLLLTINGLVPTYGFCLIVYALREFLVHLE